ncbi:hypothetical protein RB2150_08939 [Rhodobacterales bacterium HTCC2150]|nr:hypothetical protein RB2150_08939 [Rhodobacterales bacterium HTCC2150] [Rhodobacteraceae bacterium HTCC2150]
MMPEWIDAKTFIAVFLKIRPNAYCAKRVKINVGVC